MGTSRLLPFGAEGGEDHPHAYGDKLRTATQKTGCQEDHPHAYGDKLVPSYCLVRFLGSSPRVWGQAIFNTDRQTAKGIIPTRMGTRHLIFYHAFPLWDHPHAYGDKATFRFYIYTLCQSSPRVWGQGGKDVDSDICFRIIPTRMGTRLRNPVYAGKIRDHPHAYGDK